jgi:NTP pyrophosphatase (non-canonical NTP hydrolase)
MDASEYQRQAKTTAIFPENKAMEYLCLGLVGEAGEIANKVKKLIRDGADKETLEQKRIDIAYEVGDVLWYCAMLADEMNVDLGHIMEANLEKLALRKARGKLSGEGDNR